MAFLQSDLPPSTAPVKAMAPAVRRTPKASARALVTTRPNRLPGRLIGAAILFALLYLLGYVATQATESLAIGILAADLAFLVAVAGWSAVASGTRR